MRKYYIFFIFLILVLLTGCGNQEEFKVSEETECEEVSTETNDDEYTSQDEMVIATESEVIYVYICGQVIDEGVYEMPVSSRLYEAIDMAGGLTEDADIYAINQAQLLTDGVKIYIPRLGEDYTVEKCYITDSNTSNMETADSRVDINTATKEQLMTLPGIGESKAMLIINYRETNDGFDEVEDIMNIEGIKEGVFNKIKDYIKVD